MFLLSWQEFDLWALLGQEEITKIMILAHFTSILTASMSSISQSHFLIQQAQPINGGGCYWDKIWINGPFRPKNHKNQDFGIFHPNFDCKHVVDQPESLSYPTGTTNKWGM